MGVKLHFMHSLVNRKSFSLSLTRRAIIALLVTLICLFTVVAPVLACDISINPPGANGQIEDELTFSIEVARTHRNCLVPIEETQIALSGMELVSHTPWVQLGGDVDRREITVKLTTVGTGSITVTRVCPKGGGIAIAEVEIAEGVTGTPEESGTKPSPVQPPPEETDPEEEPQVVPHLLLPSNITNSPDELSWGEAFADVFSRPYVITHLVFIVLATIGLMRRWRRLRYGILLASLAYLGFYIGGCPCAIGGLQNIILHITNVKLFLIHFVLVGIPLIMSILFGRVFCGWVCPMGAVQQFIYRRGLAAKIPAKIARVLSYGKYLALAVLVIVVLATGTEAFCQIDPFESLFNVYVTPVATTLLVIVLVASLFIFSPFCRFVCPLGAFLSLFSRFSLYQLKVDITCKKCGACQKNYCDYQAIDTGEDGMPVFRPLECTRCGECIARCPSGSIKYERR